jgi:hypothetical protein
MKSAQTSGMRQLIEFWWLVGRLDQSARSRHGSRVPRFERGTVRAATFAGAEARAFGGGTGLVERDVIAPCKA